MKTTATHFGTGSDSDPPDCLVNSNSGDGPVAVAPGSKVVAAVRASTFARASKAYRTCRTVDVVSLMQTTVSEQLIRTPL